MQLIDMMSSAANHILTMYPEILLFLLAAVGSWALRLGKLEGKVLKVEKVANDSKPEFVKWSSLLAKTNDGEHIRKQVRPARRLSHPRVVPIEEQTQAQLLQTLRDNDATLRHLCKGFTHAENGTEHVFETLRRVDGTVQKSQHIRDILSAVYHGKPIEEVPRLADLLNLQDIWHFFRRQRAHRQLLLFICQCKTLAAPVLEVVLADIEKGTEGTVVFGDPAPLAAALRYASEDVRSGFLDLALRTNLRAVDSIERLEFALDLVDTLATESKVNGSHFESMLNVFAACDGVDISEHFEDLRDADVIDRSTSVRLNVLLGAAIFHNIGSVAAIVKMMKTIGVALGSTVEYILTARMKETSADEWAECVTAYETLRGSDAK